MRGYIFTLSKVSDGSWSIVWSFDGCVFADQAEEVRGAGQADDVQRSDGADVGDGRRAHGQTPGPAPAGGPGDQ